MKTHARVGVVDPFGEQINRAVDPILPKSQNVRRRDPGARLLRGEQSLKQLVVDRIEALADPQCFDEMVFVVSLGKLKCHDPLVQLRNHGLAPSLLQFAPSKLARRVLVGLE